MDLEICWLYAMHQYQLEEQDTHILDGQKYIWDRCRAKAGFVDFVKQELPISGFTFIVPYHYLLFYHLSPTLLNFQKSF